MNRNSHLATRMRQAVFMLDNAADDVRLGHYNTYDKRVLADGLALLIRDLLDDESPVVIDRYRL